MKYFYLLAILGAASAINISEGRYGFGDDPAKSYGLDNDDAPAAE